MEVFCIAYLWHIFEQQLCSLKLVIVVITIIASLLIINKWKQGGRCYSTALLSGKTVIVTGASSGIGKETARDFYRRGARVLLACCNLKEATEAAEDIKSTSCNHNLLGKVIVHHLDLANLSSIKKFAKEILAKESRIDILVNNAGISGRKRISDDGFDVVFVTNYLGHFLLTNLLLNKIKKSAPSRIVNVSSLVHCVGKMYWNDLNLNEKGAYDPLKAYSQSKLAIILFTKELAHRLQGTGVNVYALHPGSVRTGILSYMSEWFKGEYFTKVCLAILFVIKPLFKTPEQGAQTTIYCAVSDEVSNQTGLYYSDCCENKPSKLAKNEKDAKKLWDISAEMIKLDDTINEFKYYSILE